MSRNFSRWPLVLVAAAALTAAAPASAQGPGSLDSALRLLSALGKFDGAVVVRDASGVRFSRGYGFADPFERRRFTPATRVDSASLAKPVTAAAAVLLLAQDGKLDLDAPVRTYVDEYPHGEATVRQLLAHSAGLPGYGSLEPLGGKTNRDMLIEIGSKGLKPEFAPGSRFSYCNTCYNTLALLIERVAGRHYIDHVRARVALPLSVSIRPVALRDWTGRAIGFRRLGDGKVERADSYDDEAFYGSANLSLNAVELAQWGSRWWGDLAPLRPLATAPAPIGDSRSGLTLGNWYCAADRRRCHYLGHHEGFHHMLYWDADRRLAIAMVSNTSLSPMLQQRLQRAIVAYTEGREGEAYNEIRTPMPDTLAAPGSYRTPAGDVIMIEHSGGPVITVTRGAISYAGYPMGSGIRYVPGLDAYIAREGRELRWLTLYEDFVAKPATAAAGADAER